MSLPPGTAELWTSLAAPVSTTQPTRFDPDSLDGLPPPARRWLGRVLPAGCPLAAGVIIHMHGEIRIGPRWMPFTAEQILRAGVGFVWKPVVGGRLVRFVGADLLGPEDARMEFRLHGRIPVAKASGPDTAKSAAGRLAAETVAWLPQATTPQAGGQWAAVDDTHATVTLEAAGQAIDIAVGVDRAGELQTLQLQRWNGAVDPPRFRPFGGDLTSELETAGGVRVAGSGTVGWDYGTPEWAAGAFFRFRLDSLEWIGGDRG